MQTEGFKQLGKLNVQDGIEKVKSMAQDPKELMEGVQNVQKLAEQAKGLWDLFQK